ncbi:hypothetical protein DPMN_114306, partial [Dreissena polymorpha]
QKCPAPGGHVFKATKTIFKLIQDIIGKNLLTEKNAPPRELFNDIIGMNLLTKFHEDWTINVAFRVLTRFYYSHIRKNAPPLGSHVFSSKDIIETNLLTKFHEQSMQMLTAHDGRRTKGDHKSSQRAQVS